MLNISVVNKGTEGIVLLQGRLDTVASADAEKYLRSLTPKYDKLVLDFAKLDYITSAGLRILKILHVEMMKKSGSLLLRNVSDSVMSVFEQTGFTGLLEFEE